MFFVTLCLSLSLSRSVHVRCSEVPLILAVLAPCVEQLAQGDLTTAAVRPIRQGEAAALRFGDCMAQMAHEEGAAVPSGMKRPAASAAAGAAKLRGMMSSSSESS